MLTLLARRGAQRQERARRRDGPAPRRDRSRSSPRRRRSTTTSPRASRATATSDRRGRRSRSRSTSSPRSGRRRRAGHRRLPDAVGRQPAAPRRAATSTIEELAAIAVDAAATRAWRHRRDHQRGRPGRPPGDRARPRYRDVLGLVNQRWAGASRHDAAAGGRTGAAPRRPVEGVARDAAARAARSTCRGRRRRGAPPSTPAPPTSSARGRARPARRGRRVGRGLAPHDAAAGPPAGRTDLRRRPRRRRGRAVSAYPTEVTAAMLAAYREGRSTISAFAAVAGATVDAIDVGVGRADRRHPLRRRASRRAVRRARRRRRRRGRRLDARPARARRDGHRQHDRGRRDRRGPGGGEVAAVGRPRHRRRRCGLARKRQAVQQAVRRIAWRRSIRSRCCARSAAASSTAIAAAIVAARHRSLPVVLDGYVVTAAVLLARAAIPGGARPLHRRPLLGRGRSRPLLERLGKQPLLDLDMRLGEGSGAMAAGRWSRWRAPASPRCRRSASGSAEE